MVTVWTDDNIGKKFGARTILSKEPSRWGKVCCRVICSCGRESVVRFTDVSRPCKHCARLVNGLSSTALRRQWYNLRAKNSLCSEWLNWDIFLAYVGPENIESRIIRQDQTRKFEPGNILISEITLKKVKTSGAASS